MSGSTPTAPDERVRSPRIIGLDIARAFAIIGMVIVNFKITMGAEEGGPRWLRTFAALFDGRAAATFVTPGRRRRQPRVSSRPRER